MRLLLPNIRMPFARIRHISHIAKHAEEPNKCAWQSVVGLEVHAQIQARSKLFSGAASQFSAVINQQVALLDTAMPGTLPVLNKRCVEAGVLTALALNCHINLRSRFDRKHYFYADLPPGYQITQQRAPLGVGGEVSYLVYRPDAGPTKPVHKTARLVQLQLEQDSGKSLHDEQANISLIDLNRAGMALMEIVTAPDFSCGEEAACFVKEVQRILQLLGTCDGKMEEGSLRVDASVSLNLPGEPLGTRAEVKNINSVRNVAKAVDYEIGRQKELLDNGGVVTNETRAFNHDTGTTVSMRDKERLHDYRFMPEPNLPPLYLYTDDMIAVDAAKLPKGVINVDDVRRSLPRLPKDEREHLCNTYGLALEQACVLVNENLQAVFETVVQNKQDTIKSAANFIINDVLQALNKHDLTWQESHLSWQHIADIVDMLQTDSISNGVAKNILSQLVEGEVASPRSIVDEHNWWQITDPAILEVACYEVIQTNTKSVAQYRRGKKKILNSLIGQVQKNMGGRADPQKLVDILTKVLQSPSQ